MPAPWIDPRIVVLKCKELTTTCAKQTLRYGGTYHTPFINQDGVWDLSDDPPLYVIGAPVEQQRFLVDIIMFGHLRNCTVNPDLSIKVNGRDYGLGPSPSPNTLQYIKLVD